MQVAGRASRNIDAKVILYADRKTKSIKEALRETDRRRKKQRIYNKINNITPKSIKKDIDNILETVYEKDSYTIEIEEVKDLEFDKQNMKSYIENLNKEMLEYASNLEFEEAAKIRDKIKKIKSSDLGLITNKRIKKK